MTRHLRPVECPSCLRTLVVNGHERARCSPCLDIVSTDTDHAAGYIYYRNARGQLVDRKPIRQPPAVTPIDPPDVVAANVLAAYTVLAAGAHMTHQRLP